MMKNEKLRQFSSISQALAKGEANIRAGRIVRYSRTLMQEISEKGRQNAKVKNAGYSQQQSGSS